MFISKKDKDNIKTNFNIMNENYNKIVEIMAKFKEDMNYALNEVICFREELEGFYDMLGIKKEEITELLNNKKIKKISSKKKEDKDGK